jgi:hypothetical protein
VQVLTTSSGIPVEFCFVPGSESDVQALKKLPLTVAAESNVYSDSAYTDYGVEDDIRQADLINLMVQRKSNAKRKDEPWIRFLKDQMRKGIENNLFHAQSFILKKNTCSNL